MDDINLMPASFVTEILEKRGADVETLHTIAQLTKSGLDRQVLAIVLDLIENGIDAESIAQGLPCFEHLLIRPIYMVKSSVLCSVVIQEIRLKGGK